jgi:hypothetical protein
MNRINIAVRAHILSLFPQNVRATPSAPSVAPGVPQVQALAQGLAVPSFWTISDINDAFAIANRIWAQAVIEFSPVTISQRTIPVPADDNAMWIAFVNQLSPPSGIAVGFVHELPPGEGGWGGGRVAAVRWTENAMQGFHGRILAHELGHVLLNTPGHVTTTSNLMSGQRHPRVVTADLLEPGQISQARSRAQSL